MYAKPLLLGHEHLEPTSAGYRCDQLDIKMPVEEIPKDRYLGLIELDVSRGDGMLAKAFIEVKVTHHGVSVRVVTKIKGGRADTDAKATAKFFEPVFPP